MRFTKVFRTELGHKLYLSRLFSHSCVQLLYQNTVIQKKKQKKKKKTAVKKKYTKKKEKRFFFCFNFLCHFVAS